MCITVKPLKISQSSSCFPRTGFYTSA